MLAELLKRRAVKGRLEAWRLYKVYRYHAEPSPIVAHELRQDLTGDELALPHPAGAPFFVWADRLLAAGWMIDWDTP